MLLYERSPNFTFGCTHALHALTSCFELNDCRVVGKGFETIHVSREKFFKINLEVALCTVKCSNDYNFYYLHMIPNFSLICFFSFWRYFVFNNSSTIYCNSEVAFLFS